MRARVLLPFSVVVSACAVCVALPALAQTPPPPPPPVVAPPPPGVAPPPPGAPAPPDATATGAPPPGTPPPVVFASAPVYERQWYGWQTLISDGVTLVLWVAGGAANSGALTGIGTVTYLLGPPVLHAVHGRIAIGAASFGIRVGAPLILGLTGFGVGCAVGGSHGSGNSALLGLASGCATGFVVGFLLGYGGAVALDAVVFSYERVQIKAAGAASLGRSTDSASAASFTLRPDISLVPRVGDQPGRGTFGLAGTF